MTTHALIFGPLSQKSQLATLTCGSSFLLAGPLPTHFISGRTGKKLPDMGLVAGEVGEQ
jgi:hypothetical protein